MALPGGVLNYRYGPGASYREGLEHNLIETIFEDRTALEAVMKDFIGSHGKIAGLITIIFSCRVDVQEKTSSQPTVASRQPLARDARFRSQRGGQAAAAHLLWI